MDVSFNIPTWVVYSAAVYCAIRVALGIAGFYLKIKLDRLKWEKEMEDDD